MAKIIQFKGWDKGGKEENIIINADYITTITVATDNNKLVTCINIFSSSPATCDRPIYTELSVAEVIKLVNE